LGVEKELELGLEKEEGVRTLVCISREWGVQEGIIKQGGKATH
jgi:hypothetical protein